MKPENELNQKTVYLDGKRYETSGDISIYNFIRKNGKSLYSGCKDIPEVEWIHNSNCPLINIAEINGNIIPINLLKQKPILNNTTIYTESESIKDTIKERTSLLHNYHECSLVKNVQELFTADAESAGFINIKDRSTWNFDIRFSTPSIYHDPNKCIRCEACITTCRDVQGIGAITKDPQKGIIIDDRKCIRCGQCTLTCPMGFYKVVDLFTEWHNCRMCPFSRPLGAMREIDDTMKVISALKDNTKFTVVQMAPSVRSSIGEAFGIENYNDITGKLYSALKKLGFNRVWDTNFSADLTIMEEGSELLERIQENKPLPLFTSCSPGWINFIESSFPELLDHVSSAKSPQQMFGAIAKTYAAERLNIDPEKMVVVSLMPCTAKKYEAARTEMNSASKYWKQKNNRSAEYQDIDCVLTSRELVKILKIYNIDITELQSEPADPLLGEYTGAATIFGRSGGVMEAALRTAYKLLTGENPVKIEFTELDGLEGIKRSVINIDGIQLKIAVVQGIINAKVVCESVKNKEEFSDYHFIEFMCCPGGCIGGGGQIIPTQPAILKKRAAVLNNDDKNRSIRQSHENTEVNLLYSDYLEKPLSSLAHNLLHTHYKKN
jgi:iron-only hydrogenase group A